MATKGMTVALSGASKSTKAIDLTSSNPQCSKTPLFCRIRLVLPVGAYTGAVNLYDQAPVNGSIPASAHLLSTATDMTFSVAVRSITHLPLALAGIPASIAIGTMPAGAAGKAFATPQPFRVKALDAAGALIVGPYETPVTVADSDASGATTVATSGKDHPPAGQLLGSDDTATLSYTGLAIAPITVTASATGAASGTGTFAPVLQPIGPASLSGGIYVNAYGATSPISFTASEPGWTNAPYNKLLTATLSNACATIATVTPSSGTAFTPTLVSSPSNGTCTLTLSDGAGQQLIIPIGYQLFSYTSSAQNFTIPTGVTQLTINAAGAQGGSGCSGNGCTEPSVGGDGGTVAATVGVTSGPLSILVGGAGGTGNSMGAGGTNGYNGGGTGGSASGGFPDDGGGGGGGASSVSLSGTMLVVAGGGGGGGTNDCSVGVGGAGGYPTGESGGTPSSCEGGYASGGGGGTQSTGGSAGSAGRQSGATAGGVGTSGSGGAGGNSTDDPSNFGGGGGGGGYFGGGGGGGAAVAPSAGGGGGSSYYTSTATNVTTLSGQQTGNGQVVIVW